MSWTVQNQNIMPKGDNPMGNKFYGYQQTGLTLPDGRSATFHGVDVGDCVHIVGVEEDLTTYFVRQTRPNLLKKGERTVPTTLELPGGFAKVGEPLETSARMEFAEEAGKLATMAWIGTVYPSPGLSNELDHIFIGTDLVDTVQAAEKEATEQDIRIVTMPFGEAYDMMTRGEEPVAAQTLAAMALAARYL